MHIKLCFPGLVCTQYFISVKGVLRNTHFKKFYLHGDVFISIFKVFLQKKKKSFNLMCIYFATQQKFTTTR